MVSSIGERKAREFSKNEFLPVNLGALCDRNKIVILFSIHLRNIAAYYMEHDMKRIIVVNDNVSRMRQRFSIAHELGHALLGHGTMQFAFRSDPLGRSSWHEVQANAFAVELLMPKIQLKRMGYLKISQIMDICCVSREAASIRAQELGWV